MLAIPPKRRDRAIVDYLTPPEIDALLAAPDRDTWLGRRDHALLLLAVQTGLRVSELTGLHRAGRPPRRRRRTSAATARAARTAITPLTRHTVAVLRAWLTERAGRPRRPAVPHPRRRPRSAATPSSSWSPSTPPPPPRCPSLAAKNVTPHTLRHTAAMTLLHAGVDTSVIALWLGHEQTDTTQVYLHADMTIKEQALARPPRPAHQPGRYRPPDALLAFLDNL